MNPDRNTDLPPPGPGLAELLELLALDEVGADRFRGYAHRIALQRLFGGQVLAQALMAASLTVAADRLAHSAHAYFERPGTPDEPIDYTVARDRDGRSFSVRRVTASQAGEPILILSASFHLAEEPSFRHAPVMPDVPGPENRVNDWQEWSVRDLDLSPAARAFFLRDRAIETRAVPIRDASDSSRLGFWVRGNGATPRDQPIQRALLAYASDLKLLGSALRRHGVPVVNKDITGASLDHVLWIHDRIDLNDWLLYTQHSPWAGGGRALAHGAFYSRDGHLVASVAQEGLVRRDSSLFP